MRTILLETPGAKSSGTEIAGKKFSKIWIHIERMSSWLKITEAALPFAIGFSRCPEILTGILAEWILKIFKCFAKMQCAV